MLRWSLDRVDLQGRVADVGDVVPHPRGYEYDPVVADLFLEVQRIDRLAHLDKAATLFDSQELVQFGVGLQADLASQI